MEYRRKMVQRILLALILILSIERDAAAFDSSPTDGPVFTGFGVGLGVCSDWSANPDNERAGDDWIFGFWTSANLGNEKDHHVGHGLSPDEILARVRDLCRANPNQPLGQAALQAYSALIGR